MKIKALIVDDEKDAATALNLLLEKTCQNLKVVGVSGSAVEAMKSLNKEKVDLLFLDVEMPGGTGFDLLELVKDKNYYVIFTTAHSEYAIKAIKDGAKDYLLKPIDYDELVASVNKATEYIHKTQKKPVIPGNGLALSVPTANGIVLLNKEDILYIKAAGRYSEVVYKNTKHYMVCKNLGEYEQELSSDFFFRVHKSFLINCKHVMKINSSNGGFVEMSNAQEIEISKRKKADFLKFLKY